MSYFKSLLIVTLLCFLYSFNYILLRENQSSLYLGSFFTYNQNWKLLITTYVSVIPFVAYIVYMAKERIFSMLLSTLMIVGVLPGIPAYIFSDRPPYTFIFLYVCIVFLVSLISIPKLNFRKRSMRREPQNKVNLKVLHFFVSVGCTFFIYLMLKYNSIISLSSFSDVYTQRSIFAGAVSTWEIYLIVFSKYIAAYSSLMISIVLRQKRYLLPVVFIYTSDYLLASHKASLLLMLFSIIYYFKLSHIDLKKKYFPFVFTSIFSFSILLNISIYFQWKITGILISLYDRGFHVTAGLFSRFYDFTLNNYHFYGGSGILGKIFNGIESGGFYTFVIGEEYFSEGVRANADIIADGYINFGITGSIVMLSLLCLFFNKKDNQVFSDNFRLLMPLTFIYSIVLFSMGLQTSLLTGGMFFFILLIKFGFK